MPSGRIVANRPHLQTSGARPGGGQFFAWSMHRSLQSLILLVASAQLPRTPGRRPTSSARNGSESDRAPSVRPVASGLPPHPIRQPHEEAALESLPSSRRSRILYLVSWRNNLSRGMDTGAPVSRAPTMSSRQERDRPPFWQRIKVIRASPICPVKRQSTDE